MAELIVRTSDRSVRGVTGDPYARDGDVVSAWTTHRVLKANAEILCFPRDAGGRKPTQGSGHIIDPLGLAEVFCELTCGKRLTRVGEHEALIRNLVTDEEITIQSGQPFFTSDTPLPQYMNVRLWFERRLSFNRRPETRGAVRPIFGAPGAEIAYGGDDVTDATRLSMVWDEIEARTPSGLWAPHGVSRFDVQQTRLGNGLLRLGRRVLSDLLVLPVADFSETDRASFLAAEMTPGTDPATGEPGMVRSRFRAMTVAWTDLGLPRTAQQIRNRSIEVDIRQEISPLSRAVVQPKPSR